MRHESKFNVSFRYARSMRHRRRPPVCCLRQCHRLRRLYKNPNTQEVRSSCYRHLSWQNSQLLFETYLFPTHPTPPTTESSPELHIFTTNTVNTQHISIAMPGLSEHYYTVSVSDIKLSSLAVTKTALLGHLADTFLS